MRRTMFGYWITSFLFLSTFCELFTVAYSSQNDKQQKSKNTTHEIDPSRNTIMMAQFECYQKIAKDTNHNRKAGLMCNRTWDGWLCWDDVEAGNTASQHCPDYYKDFDTSEVATKICTESGKWFVHPSSNRTWTNFTTCRQFTVERQQAALNLYYLVLIGHGLSLISLLASLGIFFYFKSLSCQRITLHKNLFFSFVLNSVITIIWFTAVVNNEELVQSNQVSCKMCVFIHLYILGCMYFWMLCEGIYLHTLIVVAVFAEKQRLMWYYLLGWGFPIIPAVIHAIARSNYYNDNCWISSNTSLLYIIHGPICAALLVNLFFLLNIVRVLITKLKVTHQAETSLYMKAVRGTLILVPLLGIQIVLLAYKPEGRRSNEIYGYMMAILIHYQGLLVATIFCFFNGEVQGVLRRYWNQYRIQFGSTFANTEALRSTSYTNSSMTEVHRCYSIDSHMDTLNGKSFHHMEATILRSDNIYM
ncbi:calcitonin gene-related peptide type 1 receptor [Ictalurus punctatus]|uniref:Calcitonin gene-related peptide type 1 receptor n=1 Tax=Ictalurus punctatus TaxID=7998 RepID=A0A2D0S5H8_ICTPU|nr:calcitonin gene-related peptide type 1 receptor [Ictalurus punctatus]XP_047014997.2 calcitonin gene-related peptide type 1 receptor [Ictalurus punctatus]